MLFSILIPVYNVEDYLEECLDSIINQDFIDYEIILVDDGSIDSSSNICDTYSMKYSNVKVIHKINEGLISARRMAISESQGQFCVFCDSDDFLEKSALKKLSEIIFLYHPDLIIYKAYAFVIKGDKKDFIGNCTLEEGLVKNKKAIYEEFLSTSHLNSLCCKCVKREIIDSSNDYSKMYHFNYGEDFLQSAPILINSKTIYCSNEYLYYYRQDSGMLRTYNPNMYDSYVSVYREVAKLKKQFAMHDFEIKISAKIINAKIQQIQSLKYCENLSKKQLDNIINDPDYRKEYKVLLENGKNYVLKPKRRVVAYLVYHRLWLMIYFLVKWRRMQYLNEVKKEAI